MSDSIIGASIVSEAILKLNKSTTKLNYVMITLTIVLVIQTGVLIWLTIKMLPKA